MKAETHPLYKYLVGPVNPELVEDRINSLPIPREINNDIVVDLFNGKSFDQIMSKSRLEIGNSSIDFLIGYLEALKTITGESV